MNEKDILLEEIEEAIEEKNLSFTLIKNVVYVIIFSLFLLVPKIYISNNIYFYSVKINKLLNEYYSLQAENSILESKIEKLKFKNRLNSYSF